MKTRELIAVAVASGTLLVGCSAPHAAQSGAAASPVARATRPTVDGTVLRGSGHYDHPGYRSVSEAAKAVPVAVAGIVESWTDGRTIRDGDSDMKHAVLTVRVTDTYRSKVAGSDGLVRVEVRRGSVLIDPDGGQRSLEPGARYGVTSVDDLTKAAPVGVRVVVLAETAPTDAEVQADAGQRVVAHGTQLPEGVLILGAIPQGLLFENNDGSYVSGIAEQADVEIGSWPATKRTANGFDALRAELSRAFE